MDDEEECTLPTENVDTVFKYPQPVAFSFVVNGNYFKHIYTAKINHKWFESLIHARESPMDLCLPRKILDFSSYIINTT